MRKNKINRNTKGKTTKKEAKEKTKKKRRSKRQRKRSKGRETTTEQDQLSVFIVLLRINELTLNHEVTLHRICVGLHQQHCATILSFTHVILSMK